MEATIEFNPVYLPINQGHGIARNMSLRTCKNRLVALMDADDISYPRRFEKQLKLFQKNPKLSCIGGQITEFQGQPENIISRREVSEQDADIKAYTRKRCPMNQVTAMLDKDIVDKAGGYRDWYCDEDYYLWIRMIRQNRRFANLPDNLVNVRVNDVSARRGGMKYFQSEKRRQSYMLHHGMITLPEYWRNVLVRFGGEVVAGNGLRKQLFRFMRSTPEKVQESSRKSEVTSSKLENGTEQCPPFSVAICVYGKDNPEWFDTALDSIIVHQTVKPNEVVLVVDGPVPDTIQRVIDKYSEICVGGTRFKVIQLPENKGLGNALQIAVKACSHELIARMDSDDIAVEGRFEEQLQYFNAHPDMDILGGNIDEFIDDIENVVGSRVVPTRNDEIRQYIKKRCPFNHMTVMYKKSAVKAAGGYRDWFWNEDYYLWIRMYLKNAVMVNTGTVLVKARVGKDMYKRRGGQKYFESEIRLQKYMLQHQMINTPTYIDNVAKRFIMQKLLPDNVRGWVFQKFARK